MGHDKSLVALYVHAVWGTRRRMPLIQVATEAELHAIIAARTRELSCTPLAIGGVADHVHLLAQLHPAVSVAKLIGEVKGASAHAWNKRFGPFAWQSGYAAFTIAPHDVAAVSSYVLHQREHHARCALNEIFELPG